VIASIARTVHRARGALRPRGLAPGGAARKVPAMALLRRALAAVGIAGIIAAVLRLRGSGGTPPQSGGWRELSGPDLR
jgi:hypothetical protein